MADDPNRTIGVNLSLLSGEDSQAAKELAQSLTEIQSLFTTLKSGMDDYAKNLNELAKKMQTAKPSDAATIGQAGTQTTAPGPGGAGGPSLSTPPTPEATKERLGYFNVQTGGSLGYQMGEGGWKKGGVYKGLQAWKKGGWGNREARYAGMREFLGEMEMPQGGGPAGVDDISAGMDDRGGREGGGGGGGPGGPGGTAPTPGDGGGGSVPRAVRGRPGADALDWTRVNEPLQAPRFGEMTWQDRFGWVAQRRQREGLEQATQADPQVQLEKLIADAGGIGNVDEAQLADFRTRAEESATTRSQRADELLTTSAMWQHAADLVPIGTMVKQDFARARDFVNTQVPFANPMNWEGAGIGLGDRSQAQVGPFGVTNPFGGGAAAEGRAILMQTARRRLEGGINEEQANRIGQVQQELGFRGDLGARIGDDILTDYVQQTGMDPGALMPIIGQVTRTEGAGALDDLRDQILSMSDAAEAAQMNLEDFQASLVQVGEAAQAQGGTLQEGMQRGMDFSTATGLDPTVSTAVGESPLMQANLTRRTGLPTNLHGMIPGSTFNETAYETFDQLTGMYDTPGNRAMFGDEGEEIKDAEGNVIGKGPGISGRKAAQRMAGQHMGLNPNQLKAFQRNRRTFKERNRLQAAAAAYDENLSKATKGVKGGDVPGFMPGMTTKQSDREARDAAARKFDKGGHGDAVSFEELEGLMEDAKFSEKEMEKVREADRPFQRREAIDKILQKKQGEGMAEEGPQVRVKFTGRAEKFFEQVTNGKGKRDENAGIFPVNDKAGSFSGPSPLPIPGMGD